MKYLIILVSVALMSCGVNSKMKYLDPKNIDKGVKLGDDFYHHFNGQWLKENPIPEDETRWGSFLMLRDRTLANQKIILDQLMSPDADFDNGSPEQKVADFYRSGMEKNTRAAEGMELLKKYVASIDKCNENEELLATVLELYSQGIGSGFAFYIGVDDKNVNRYLPTFSQGGLGLPDRDYYFKEDAKFDKIREEYKKFQYNLLKYIEPESQAMEDASGAYKIEEILAKVSMDRVTRRDPDKTYNIFTKDQFEEKFDALNWEGVMSLLGVPEYREILVSQPDFLQKWSYLWKDNELSDLKAYYKFHLVNDLANYISDEMEQTNFDFYGKILGGQQVQKDKWKRVQGTINGNIGELMGQLYVKQFFKPEAKEKMNTLVNNLQVAYGKRIQNLSWMSDVTKTKAMEKLNSFTKKIGYPDKWKDYSSLQITPKSYVANVIKSWTYQYKDNIAKYGKPVDKEEWYMSPQTVNAYYNPAFNEIVFPAAILAFPFFDPGADDAVNYGGIGAVIGHEMTHGFDDQGAKYAADGNLRNWWTAEDEKAFKSLTGKLVEEFNNYTVLDSVHVNGELTLGENIADLGGLAIAYDAFMQTNQAKEGKKIDGYTPEQRFFMSWAQIWRGDTRPETQLQYILTDPHSPGLWRCNGPITNHDAWYQAFGISTDAKMYKEDKDRVKIW